MSNSDFFIEKKDWSKVKDAVLGSYLKPYFNKVLGNGSVTYIDSFAGKGVFDDGNIGSPLIAYQVGADIIDAKEKQGMKWRYIKYIFIDNHYAPDLRENTKGLTNVEVIDGTYQGNITRILNESKTRYIFVYIDPFGIKYLSQKFFHKMFEKRVANYSIETLVNFNSYGFIREACRLLKSPKETELQNVTQSLEERSDTELYGTKEFVNDIENMNNIAGGDYWQELIARYSNDELNMNETEDLLALQYTKSLRDYFTFSISFPIKSKEYHSVPRYRLVFATNYYQGYILMVENMQRRHQDDKENTWSQESLFEFDISSGNRIIDFDYEEIFLEFVTDKYRDLYKIIMKALDKYSISLNIKHFCNTGRELEKSGIISVLRNPEYTPKGRKSSFFSWERSVKIKRI